jgi:hypothetical protein
MAHLNRRCFLTVSAGALAARVRSLREYHVCLSPTAIEGNPELLAAVHRAGVTHVWSTGFLYGHWHYTPERTGRMLSLMRKQGVEAHAVNVPLGHPGGSLGTAPGTVRPIPPPHWRRCVSATRLSAANMAAKLAVPTLAHVRNTMFMSGLEPFPASHGDTLGPAM